MKRLFAFIFSAALLLSLAGCGETSPADEGEASATAASKAELAGDGAEDRAALRESLFYRATGTGRAAETTPYFDQYTVEISSSEDLDGLADGALRETVLSIYRELTEKAEVDTAACTQRNALQYGSEYSPSVKPIVTFTCQNGYLSILVEVFQYSYHTAVIDLYTGQRLAFSDLFPAGCEFVDTLNRYIRSYAASFEGALPYAVEHPSLKREFVGIPADFNSFTTDCVYFSNNDPCFTEATEIPLNPALSGCLLPRLPRNMAGIWKKNVTVLRSIAEAKGDRLNLYSPTRHYDGDECGNILAMMNPANYNADVCRRVNEQMIAFTEEQLSDAGKTANLAQLGGATERSFGCGSFDPSYSLLGNRFILYSGGYHFAGEIADGWNFNDPELNSSSCWFIDRNTGEPVEVPSWLDWNFARFFDAATGEALPLTALLRDGWQASAKWEKLTFTSLVSLIGLQQEYGQNYFTEYPDRQPTITTISALSPDSLHLATFSHNAKDGLNFIFYSGDRHTLYRLTVPERAVDW